MASGRGAPRQLCLHGIQKTFGETENARIAIVTTRVKEENGPDVDRYDGRARANLL